MTYDGGTLAVHHFEEGTGAPGRVVATASHTLQADEVELGLAVAITVEAFDFGQDALEPRWHRVVGQHQIVVVPRDVEHGLEADRATVDPFQPVGTCAKKAL